MWCTWRDSCILEYVNGTSVHSYLISYGCISTACVHVSIIISRHYIYLISMIRYKHCPIFFLSDLVVYQEIEMIYHYNYLRINICLLLQHL